MQGFTEGNKELNWVRRRYRGLQGVTEGYKKITEGYKGLQRVTGSDRGLQGLTEGYKRSQGVTKG